MISKEILSMPFKITFLKTSQLNLLFFCLQPFVNATKPFISISNHQNRTPVSNIPNPV